MSKFMRVEMTDGFTRDATYLYADECPNIIKKVNDIHGKITDEEIGNAIDILISVFVEQKINTMIVNIDERNTDYASAKEMTLEDIEEALGYKVKIVNK